MQNGIAPGRISTLNKAKYLNSYHANLRGNKTVDVTLVTGIQPHPPFWSSVRFYISPDRQLVYPFTHSPLVGSHQSIPKSLLTW